MLVQLTFRKPYQQLYSSHFPLVVVEKEGKKGREISAKSISPASASHTREVSYRGLLPVL